MVRRQLNLGLLCVGAYFCSLGCGGAATPVEMLPEGQSVHTGTTDATEGMQEIGTIEVRHGGGCGLYGHEGNYESAYAMLRNEAARRGATYVKILQVLEPHTEGGCYEVGFVIRGLAYSGGVPQPAASAGGEQASCDPPCSPGYRCENSTCIALCNPPCQPGFACADDRTCQATQPADASEPE